MKKIFYALGLTVVLNIAGTAQDQTRPAKTVDSTAKQSVNTKGSGNVSASGNAASLSAVTNLQAELQNTLDVKNAKIGDQVILRTTQSVKQAGQVIIPKGTQLVGRVTDVQQRTKNGAASRLGLMFDKLQNRDLTVPITASIVSITNLRAANMVSEDLNSDLSSTNSTSARTSSSGSSGGGLLGGITNTVGGVVGATTQTVGTVANTATNTVGGTTQTLGRTVNGIQISSSAAGSAQTSTTLSSPNNNIRLEKGITFNLNIQKNGAN